MQRGAFQRCVFAAVACALCLCSRRHGAEKAGTWQIGVTRDANPERRRTHEHTPAYGVGTVCRGRIVVGVPI